MAHQILQPAPPVAHAISGSLGSALALLLLYPLERVRTELQATASSSSSSSEPPSQHEEQTAGDNPEERETVGSIEDSPKSNASNESWVTCSSLSGTNLKDGEIASSTTEPMLPVLLQQQPASTSKVTRQDGDNDDRPQTMFECLLDLQRRNQLYRGVLPVVTTMGITNFVFFFAHQAIKGALMAENKSAARALLASTLAGVINVLMTNPLWVANLRIVQSSSVDSHSLWKALRTIVQKEGISNLWNGTMTSLLLVSNPVIQFFCYEQLKQLLLARRQQRAPSHKLSPAQAFVLGAFAKAVATVATYPLQLAQVLLRLNGGEEQYEGTVDCLVKLYEAKGPVALFRGIQAKLLLTTLTAALTFLSYEQILTVVAKLTVGPASPKRAVAVLKS